MEAPSEGRLAARQRVEQLQWKDERVQAIVASWPNGRTPGLECPKCRMKAMLPSLTKQVLMQMVAGKVLPMKLPEIGFF